MKKNFGFLAIVLLTLALVGFAFDRIVPANTAHAASDAQTAVTSDRFNTTGVGTVSPENDAVPLKNSAPVVGIVTGIVCVLFGVIAAAPLLVGDPKLSQED